VSELVQKVAQLRERAQAFNAVMDDLERVAHAVKQNPQAFNAWQKLVVDGRSIRAAIETATRLIDGSRKWTARYLQQDAAAVIPFADDVISATTGGAITAIDTFIERATLVLPGFEKLNKQLGELPEEERKAIEARAIPQTKQSIVPAMLLIAALGGLVLFGDRLADSFGGDDD
jgi:uncharacterized protein YigA (DUF484 family)